MTIVDRLFQTFSVEDGHALVDALPEVRARLDAFERTSSHLEALRVELSMDTPRLRAAEAGFEGATATLAAHRKSKAGASPGDVEAYATRDRDLERRVAEARDDLGVRRGQVQSVEDEIHRAEILVLDAIRRPVATTR